MTNSSKKAKEKKKKVQKKAKKFLEDVKKTGDKEPKDPSVIMETLDPEDEED